MRKPRVTSFSKPIKSGIYSQWLLALLMLPLKLLGTFLPILPLLLVVGVFFLPETPHLRWQYEYRLAGQERHYVRCDYWGVHGKVSVFTYRCPLITFFAKGV